MGRLLIDPSADFSANPVGHAGLNTSVTNGLIALHELRYSRSKACHNSAPGELGGTEIGSPTYSDTSINVTKDNSILFGCHPKNGGYTFAFVVKLKNGGTVSDGVVGAFDGSGATTGTAYAYHYNRRTQLGLSCYPAGTVPPLSGVATLAPFLDSVSGDDGKFRLFIATAEDNVAATLYYPGGGTSNAASAVGKEFLFNGPAEFRTCPLAGTTAQDVALFAHWNRVITSDERAAFYSEMKEQFARFGVTL